MKRINSFCIGCVAVVAFYLIPTTSTAVTFSDQNFFSQDWTPIIHVRDDELIPGIPPGPPFSSGNMTQLLTGGNIGAYFHTFIFLEPGYAINTSGIYTGETYDPGEQAISSLNFSYSVKQFDVPPGSETGIRPALLQDGRLFVAPRQLFDGNSWVSRSPPGTLNASDFDAVDKWFTGAIIHPDFSAFGESIQFGFSLQNNNPTAFDVPATRGIDNWLVTINQAAMSDIHGDGVDSTDFDIWSAGFGIAADGLLVDGDFDRDVDVDGADFLKWQREYGMTSAMQAVSVSVPEPSTMLLVFCGILAFSLPVYW